jgi:hypothetical protein
MLLGACGSPRGDAAAELLRLDEAMTRHAAQHGRFPETLDAGRPASPTNLPYTPERKVSLRLGGVTRDGYHSTARARSWLCNMSVSPRQKTQPDCFPLSGSARDLPDTARPRTPSLPFPSAPAADSGDTARPPG